MANILSFVTANFIARQSAYHLSGGWDEGQAATEAYFRPPGTFEARFDDLLAEVCGLGFTGVDIWTGHLNPAWATAGQVAAARRCLDRQGLALVSVAGYFGATLDEFEAACWLAAAAGAPLLGGVAPVLETHPSEVLALLGAYGLQLAVENHQQRTASELRAIVDGAAEVQSGSTVSLLSTQAPAENRRSDHSVAPAGALVGACVDTGSFATRGYDATLAIAELGPSVMHIHLRDVLPNGSDESVAFGQGCVPLAGCVAMLRQSGYAGAFSVEHEPEDRDPGPECQASLAALRGWLVTTPTGATSVA